MSNMWVATSFRLGFGDEKQIRGCKENRKSVHWKSPLKGEQRGENKKKTKTFTLKGDKRVEGG